MRINLTRIVKSGDGYQGTSIDQLINKDEKCGNRWNYA